MRTVVRWLAIIGDLLFELFNQKISRLRSHIRIQNHKSK